MERTLEACCRPPHAGRYRGDRNGPAEVPDDAEKKRDVKRMRQEHDREKAERVYPEHPVKKRGREPEKGAEVIPVGAYQILEELELAAFEQVTDIFVLKVAAERLQMDGQRRGYRRRRSEGFLAVPNR